jgi:hypothetical protein
MKARIDRFFAEGINATLLHVNIHQPYEALNPGMSAWFGNDFNRKNTWFSQLDLFTGYLRRSNYMLQQGAYVAHVAYFIGEDTPKMIGAEDPRLPEGYAFDYMNAEVLLTRAVVKDGCLTLPDGMKYHLLVLPDQKSMRPEVLRKISELVREGLAVYGDAPAYSPGLAGYPDADEEVRRLGEELFAAGTYGAGKVFRRGTDMQEALNTLGIHPDFRAGTNVPVLYIHRTLADGEVYFLSNQSGEKVSFEGTFHVAGGLSPELWDPVTAEIRYLPDFRRSEEGNTVLHIDLEGNESAFIVFRKGVKAGKTKKNYVLPNTLCRINTPWSVTFEAGRRGPDKPVAFPQLTDWAESADESIRYFSGEAVYTTTFPLEELPAKELYLSLGSVMVMAKVTLNGQYVGGVWTAPYRLNVTPYLKAGENRLEVTVVNNWQNRLIGDQSLPKGQRPTWTVVNPWKAGSPLQPSGLLGPVEIQAFDYEIR